MIAKEREILAEVRDERITEALERLVALYKTWDKSEDAEKWSAKLGERREKSRPREK